MNKNNIVSIDAVIARIKMNGYIDCNEYDDYYDIHEYDNILFYLEKYKDLQSKIDKAIEYIEKDTRWFDSEYASIYGELCDCEGYNANRLEVMINPSNLLKILKEE